VSGVERKNINIWKIENLVPEARKKKVMIVEVKRWLAG